MRRTRAGVPSVSALRVAARHRPVTLIDPWTHQPYTPALPEPTVADPAPVERRYLSPDELAALRGRTSPGRLPRPIAGLNFRIRPAADQSVLDAECAFQVAECDGNMRRAAAALGCSYQTVARRMRRYRGAM